MSDSRVSIPETLQKTIDEIKAAIGEKHSDDDIYTVLEDCNMDADETIRKFLYLETFEEVKSKHQKKVVIVNNNRRVDNQYSSYNNGGRQFNARRENNGRRKATGRASKSSNIGPAVASSVANGSSNHQSTSRSATTNGAKSRKRPEKLNIIPGSNPGPTPASTPTNPTPVVSKSAAVKPGQLSSQSDPVLDPSLNARNHGAIQRIQNVKDDAVVALKDDLCSKQAELHISGRPHSVIFPKHLRIPEDIKSTLLFGTMDSFLEQSNDTEASKNASQTPESSSAPISDQPQENIASSADQTKQETINYALQGENGTQLPTQTRAIAESSAAVSPQTYPYTRQQYPSYIYDPYYPQLYMTPPAPQAGHNFPSVRSMPLPQSLHQSTTPPLSSYPHQTLGQLSLNQKINRNNI